MAQAADAAALAQHQGQGQSVAPIFLLTPALLGNGNTFLDLTKPENQKLYKKSIKKLNMVFEGNSGQIILLTQATPNPAEQLGFTQTIMKIQNGDNVNRHLIDSHGLLSYQNI